VSVLWSVRGVTLQRITRSLKNTSLSREQHIVKTLSKHRYDPSFDDEGLDTHFWKECPMLTSCPKCEQVIEISDLNEHLLEECAHKSECKQCPRCREAIAIAFYEVHTQRRKCLPATDTTVRCPLCHVNIGDLTDDSVDPWRRHLLEEGCPKNPRIQSSY